MVVFVLALIFGLIVLFEIPGVLERKFWRELVSFGLLWVIGLVMNLLIFLNKAWPPQGTAITNLFKAIFPGFFELIKL